MKSNDQKFKELVKDHIRTEGFRAKVDQCLMSLGGFGSWVVLWLGLCFSFLHRGRSDSLLDLCLSLLLPGSLMNGFK